MAITKPEEQQAATPPAPPVKREFRPLQVGDRVDRCSYILPNKLQCWKAGEEEVTEYVAPTLKAVKESGAKIERYVYQLCERHTKIQKALDAGLLKPENINTPMKEMTMEPPATPPDYEAAPADQTQAEQESAHPVKYEEAEQLKSAAPKIEEIKQKQEAAAQQSSPQQKDTGGFFHHQK
jgi:hypothetical protein